MVWQDFYPCILWGINSDWYSHILISVSIMWYIKFLQFSICWHEQTMIIESTHDFSLCFSVPRVIQTLPAAPAFWLAALWCSRYRQDPAGCCCRSRVWTQLHQHQSRLVNTKKSYEKLFMHHCPLTLNLRGPGYLGLTRSVSWLLLSWLLPSPGHQQTWYWLCRMGNSLSYLRKDFNHLCHISVEERHKM